MKAQYLDKGVEHPLRKLISMMMMVTMMTVITLIIPAYALPECQRVTENTKIPCNIISSYGTTCTGTINIYNSTSVAVLNLSWGNFGTLCNATFNLTYSDTYTYNSTIESGIITVVGNDDMIFIIFVPLSLCFLFIFWASSLGENQEPLKWFMRLLSLVMIFLTFGAANMIINKNPGYEGLQQVFNFGIVQVIFYVIFAIALLTLLIKVFMSFKEKRDRDFEDGVIR